MTEQNTGDTQSGVSPAATGFAKPKTARRKRETSSSLNINSLLDILTILLVFLLVSISSDPLNVQQNAKLRLPKMSHGCGVECLQEKGVKPGSECKAENQVVVCRDAYRPPEDTVPITITKSAILLDNKEVKTSNGTILELVCMLDGKQCQEKDIKDKFTCGQLDEEANTTDQKLQAEGCTASKVRRLSKMEFSFSATDKGGDKGKFLILPLQKELESKKTEIEERIKRDAQAKGGKAHKWKPMATIIADGDIPFRPIAEVIYTAGMAKLHDLRFATIQRATR
ncbi:MAG: hypothetical protein CMH54_12525 [Myxococcales bacterium]|nr:hypothetical protein [Myxococcales bacterium]|tara:strand:- start:1086 stop:1934 length:849 start_codon:yes stop_codon:yes gene_type:complete